MKKNIVFVKNNSFIYKDIEYGFYELAERNMKFRNLKVVILEEELYIKSVLIKSRFFKLERCISDEIKNVLSQSREILYDYEKNNKEKSVYIYSIRGKENVEKLCSQSNSLEVIPIQFIIRKALKNVLKKYKFKDYMSLIKLHNKYYFIRCVSELFDDNYVSENLENICNYINSKYEKEIIIIDNNCYINEYYFEKMEIIKKDIMGAINEIL